MARVAIHPQVGGAVQVADFRLEEIEVPAACEGVGKTLQEVRADAAIVAVRRTDGELVAQPEPETVVAAGRHAGRDRDPGRAGAARSWRFSRSRCRAHERAAANGSGSSSRRPRSRSGATAPSRRSASRSSDPSGPGQGDYSTNAAMLLAPALKASPREIAERVGAALTERLGPELRGFDVAGPGFVNLTLSDGWHRAALASVLDAGERFGSGGAAPPERILLEFVSANPTGPVVAANGQSAAYGDSLARILQHHGHDVQREYYVNDAGSQIARFGESVIARANGTEVPEGGYQGEYVAELAAQIPDAGSLAPAEAGDRAVQLLLVTIRETLERYGVHYDQFFSERTAARRVTELCGASAGARRRGQALVRVRRRAVAALDDVRRREGPGAAPLGRGPDVPGLRRRLSAGEARARL